MRVIKFRRRRESKTDYQARFNLLKSGLPRVVIRKTDKYILAQIVTSKEAQDYTIVQASSKDLKKFSWPNGSKNLAAAYLTGILLMKRYVKKNPNKSNLILDIGLQRSTKGSRIYAVVKGVLDAGFKISCNKEILPKEDRIFMEYKNKKIKEVVIEVKKQIEKNG